MSEKTTKTIIEGLDARLDESIEALAASLMRVMIQPTVEERAAALSALIAYRADRERRTQAESRDFPVWARKGARIYSVAIGVGTVEAVDSSTGAVAVRCDDGALRVLSEMGGRVDSFSAWIEVDAAGKAIGDEGA